MPRPTPVWKKKLPEFLEAIDRAENEEEILKVCVELKKVVLECYPDKLKTVDDAMKQIRKAIRENYPHQPGKSPDEAAPFPWYFTNTQKGHIERWEHLAIKHLSAEWNKKTDWTEEKSDTIIPVSETEEQSENITSAPSTETNIDILNEVDLEGEELAAVKQTIGDGDVKEWVKLAILQRHKAIKALHERLNEDLSLVPSDELMNEKKYRTNPNASRELVSRAVRAIKKYNNQSPEHKWCITNKLISELTSVTPKAIAKVVEGMGIEGYNAMQGLTPVVNRMTKAAVGSISDVVSIVDVLGVDV